MSYPESRYTGETGEISATFRRAGQPAELDYRSGNAVHYLATGKTTEGRFGLYRWDFSTRHDNIWILRKERGRICPLSFHDSGLGGGVGGSTTGVMRYCR
jgi:hypothetical protein